MEERQENVDVPVRGVEDFGVMTKVLESRRAPTRIGSRESHRARPNVGENRQGSPFNSVSGWFFSVFAFLFILISAMRVDFISLRRWRAGQKRRGFDGLAGVPRPFRGFPGEVHQEGAEIEKKARAEITEVSARP